MLLLDICPDHINTSKEWDAIYAEYKRTFSPPTSPTEGNAIEPPPKEEEQVELSDTTNKVGKGK